MRARLPTLARSPRLAGDDRDRLPLEDDVSGGQNGAAPAVGYRWAGALQISHSQVRRAAPQRCGPEGCMRVSRAR
jgi:hypothetical protein